jgi:hypothetical protein
MLLLLCSPSSAENPREAFEKIVLSKWNPPAGSPALSGQVTINALGQIAGISYSNGDPAQQASLTQAIVQSAPLTMFGGDVGVDGLMTIGFQFDPASISRTSLNANPQNRQKTIAKIEPKQNAAVGAAARTSGQSVEPQKFLMAIANMRFPDFGANGFENGQSIGLGAQIVGTADGQQGTKLVIFQLANGPMGQAVCISLNTPAWMCQITATDSPGRVYSVLVPK